MRKIFFLAAAMVLLVGQAFAQRAMDKLDRGLVAVAANNGVLVSWRVLGEDADNVKFNLYRDGVRVNAEPLTVSNYLDASGSVASKYTVKTVVDGAEKETSRQSIALPNGYLEIKVAPVPSNKDGNDISSDYEPNDATIADLDGDGQMEILIKLRNNADAANGYSINNTDYDIIQVYKLDGTLMWWIDCGPNMVDFQSNEINIAAYDWDQDGKAECILRAGDGMVIHQADGTKYVVGDPTQNTRNQLGNGGGGYFTRLGNEHLLYLNGETGAPYQVLEYPLPRFEKGESDLNAAWGDGYGHRSNKHFFGAPYLDGRKPSIFIARGIYTRHKMIAYDVDPATHKLVERWRWYNNQAGSPWYGQGYHNYSVADVDWDGRDEIVFGSMVIDDNGQGLSTTGLGHGDSHHVGDLNPYIYGQEVVACNEDNPGNNYRDATTSKIYYRKTAGDDDGRCIAGNFTNLYPGCQFTSARDFENLISTVSNAPLAGTGSNGVAQNFRIFWDGDLLDETFNGQSTRNSAGVIFKYGQGAIHTFTGTLTNNDTKATPCFQGDIFGDWREELILRASDNRSIRIYSTPIPTDYRIYTLLHDPQYRNAMVWQMNGYNQTPHPSFFLGELEGITQAPPSPTMNNRQEVNGSISATDNGKNLIFAAVGNASASLTEGASPELFVDNTPTWVQGHGDNDNITTTYFTHTITGDGFGGNTKVIKLGGGKLILPATVHKHTGNTEIWYGTLALDGELANSPLWMNRHTTLESNGGKFSKGIEMNYGATMVIGGENSPSTVTTTDLVLNFGSKINIDLFADGLKADQINAGTVTIEKKVWENGPELSTPVIEFRAHYLAGQTKLPGGEYVLGTIGTVKGNLNDIVINGLNGQKASLAINNGKLVLNVYDTREATDIVWTGANGSTWDLAETTNFVIQATGEPTTFVAGDRVLFDDTAVGTTVNIPSSIYPSAIVFNNNSKNFTIGGAAFEGQCSIEKKGTGRVTLNNTSTFTGEINVNNGVLSVASLGSDQGTATGSLGQYTNPIKLDGGGMISLGEGKMSHPLTATNGGIEVTSGTLTLSGTTVKGNGIFIKAGNGQLNFSGSNTIETLRIDGGKVYDEGDSNSVGKTVVFNGTNVELLHSDSRYSYSTDNANLVVPEGKSGKLTLDGRCTYKGTLTGKGTLEVVSSFVRNTLEGNWSEFEGTLKTSQASGSSFDFYSAYDLAKAELMINSGCEFKNTNAQDGRARNSSMKLGALSGSGNLAGLGTYYIGGRGDDCSFSGQVSANINIVKEGNGTLTISKVQPSLNDLTINEGAVYLRSNSASQTETMTGKGSLSVKGTLQGCGYVGNPTATFESGATIYPTTSVKRNTFRALVFTGNVTMQPGSKIQLDIVDATKYSSINVSGSLDNSAEVTVTFNEYTPKLDDSFTLWTAGSADKVPSLILPDLPEDFMWDTSAVTATEGTVKIVAFTGIYDIAADEIVSCNVIAVDGKIVKSFTTRASEVMNECRQLGAGAYLLNVAGNSHRFTQKIVL
ncbi:MAG: hypothetical protein NC343_03610 [Muribaculum sp.]|nr:hypothetical protein [Muribaculaceae bacterium]MCM1080815.1 hypothetical protein [Muribaculum sp.]